MVLYSYLILISLLSLVTVFFVFPIFFYEYLRKENVNYSLVKLLPYFPMLIVFLIMFYPDYNDLDNASHRNDTTAAYEIWRESKNEELIKRAEKLINFTDEKEIEPLGDVI